MFGWGSITVPLPPGHAVVVAAWTAPDRAPLALAAGDSVFAGREDDEYPGWFWCRSGGGREGWVHRSCLRDAPGLTSATRAYTARELTVRGLEQGEVLEQLGGWAWLRLADGRTGWLPARVLAGAGLAGGPAPD